MTKQNILRKDKLVWDPAKVCGDETSPQQFISTQTIWKQLN